MPQFSPESLAAWTGGRWTSVPAGELTGFTQDTRQLRAGQVFIAIKTERRDGHDFLETAAASGASAALVTVPTAGVGLPQLVVPDTVRAFQLIAARHREAFSGPVVGVSGSCGKTSTKNLLALLLGERGGVLATEGNLNNHLGVPLTLTRLDASQHRHAVLEAGISGPGEMDVLGEMIQPDAGVITLVAPAHTQELGGLEGVAREKARLLHHVRPGGFAVIPGQCHAFAAFRELPCATVVVAPVEAPSAAPGAVLFKVESSGDRTRLVVDGRPFLLRRLSAGMAQNAALALVTASRLGVSDLRLQQCLDSWGPAPLRGEIVREGGQLYYVDCYNANPAAMSDALAAFVEIAPPEQPRLFVLGGMEELGAEAARYHSLLGETAPLRLGDEVWLVGTHARDVAGAIEARRLGVNVEIAPGWEPVGERLRQFSGSVFVKGSRRYELEKALPHRAAVSTH